MRKRFWNHPLKTILASALVLFLLSGLFPLRAAAEVTEPGYEFQEELFADESRYQVTQMIRVPFEIPLEEGVFDYEFPYTDDFFRLPSDHFSKTVAQGSLGLAISAFRNENDLKEDQWATYLSAAGFSDLYGFGYDQPTQEDTLSGVIAHREVDDFTVLACIACGQGYKKEWVANLNMGDEERHAGFALGAQIMEEQIAAYREQYHITGKIKVWISGFSRSAAVGNLVAADLIDSGEYEDVYAYLFGVPRTTRNPHYYSGIYNVCGQYDPVTNVPLEEWGYYRNGLDLFTPAQESDANYSMLQASATKVYEEITGKPLRNNPQTNHQIHLIMEFMQELLPTTVSYINSMQTPIMEIWTEPDQEHIFEILSALMGELDNLDEMQSYKRDIFVDYISWLLSVHLQGSEQQIAEGTWDPEASIPANLLREHQPVTYVAWAFCDYSAEEIYDGNWTSRMVVIEGSFDLSVYGGEQLVGSIDRNGVVSYPEQPAAGGETLPRLYMVQYGNQTVVMVPWDEEWRFVLEVGEPQFLMYYEFSYEAGSQKGTGEYINAVYAEEGTYALNLSPLTEMGRMETITGKTRDYIHTEAEYSASLIMATESNYDNSMITPAMLITIASALGIGLLILIVFCLAVAILHAIRKKRGHGAFSPWWIIVPHLILIATAAGLTCFCVWYFYVIEPAKTIPATVTAALVLILAVRAYFRCRNRGNLIRMAVLAGLTLLTYLFFAGSFFASRKVPYLVLYILCVGALSVWAIAGFFSKKNSKKSAEEPIENSDS